MSELKPCPCCNEVKYICNFTISLELGIVMFGCSKCAFFAENITVWNNRPHENKIQAEAIRGMLRSIYIDSNTVYIHSHQKDWFLQYANKLEMG